MARRADPGVPALIPFALILLVLGLSGLAGQIVLLREFLVVASGNELAIGLFLGAWLLLESAGCLLAGRLWGRSQRPAAVFAAWQAAFAALLPAALYATRCLRELAGAAPGEGLGAAALLFWALALLAPVGLPHGALFALAGRLRERERPGASPAGLVYGWETLGTLAGGLLLTFWLIPRWDSFRIVLAVGALDLLFCVAVLLRARDERSPRLLVLCALAAATAPFIAFGPADESLHRGSVRRQWPGAEVAFYENSVYGNITVLRSEGQATFLTDGKVAAVSPVPDIEAAEELAHLPLLSHPRPEAVLVLGGGAAGLLREVLKHPVRRVDYAELDPLFLEALARFAAPLTAGELQDPRVRVHRVDGRLFARDAAGRYDAVIVGSGEPDSLQSNRLFTREFFALARRRLKPGGLLAFSLPGSTAFLDRNRASLNSCVLQAAAGVFAAARPIPGDTNIFLASDDPALSGIAAGTLARRLRQRRIRTGFVGPGQLSLRLEEQWTRQFQGFLAPVAGGAGVNRDFNPRAVIHALADWNAMFSPAAGRLLASAEAVTLPRLAAVLAVALLAALAWRRRSSPAAAPAALAATGFVGMLYSMALIFAFQALYGYAYLWVGLLVSVFMAGAAAASLAVGAVGAVRSAGRAFLFLEAALAVFSAALPVVFEMLAGSPVPDNVLQGAFLALCLASGALTGAQFPLACRLSRAGMAPLYACDLAGGVLGAVFGGALLLPVLGLAQACLAAALLKVASLVFCLVSFKVESSPKS
ncbi:MAG: fused MFS/spermidine synthase [Elusimicrobia bacterium]|nr:fused MFS/spermidine synthase [Elusimicrobiota bacterium]